MNKILGNNKGLSLLIVLVYTAIIFLLTSSLLLLINNGVIHGKQEGAIVQARYIAEAGIAKALANYSKVKKVEAEPFGRGFYWYDISDTGGDQIEIVSQGARYKVHSRLPAVKLVTHWEVVPNKEKTTFKLLSRQEQMVPLP